jgi:hypothetical protein
MILFPRLNSKPNQAMNATGLTFTARRARFVRRRLIAKSFWGGRAPTPWLTACSSTATVEGSP